jgi:hypothetical protein
LNFQISCRLNIFDSGILSNKCPDASKYSELPPGVIILKLSVRGSILGFVEDGLKETRSAKGSFGSTSNTLTFLFG